MPAFCGRCQWPHVTHNPMGQDGVTKEKKEMPPCFGDLDLVFPKGKHGLRNTPETCFACLHKTECLRTAMRGPSGLRVKEESLDRSYKAGAIGFLERWSQKKGLQRRMKARKKGRS